VARESQMRPARSCNQLLQYDPCRHGRLGPPISHSNMLYRPDVTTLGSPDLLGLASVKKLGVHEKVVTTLCYLVSSLSLLPFEFPAIRNQLTTSKIKYDEYLEEAESLILAFHVICRCLVHKSLQCYRRFLPTSYRFLGAVGNVELAWRC
jgi:hypothetical protein